MAPTAGAWSLNLATATPSTGSLTTLTTGTTYSVTATVTDTAGNATSDTTSSELSIVSGPSQTVNIVAMSNDSGSSATDFITNDGSAGRTVTGTLSAALGINEVVEVSVDGGTTWTTATTTGTNWTVTDAGSHNANWTIEARVTNTLANASGTVDSQSVSYDASTPTPLTGSLTHDATNDTGTSATDNLTNNTKPALSGTAEANSAIAVTINGLTYNTTADANGAWSVNVTNALADSTYTASITSTDVAGNSTTANATLFTVDTSLTETTTGSLIQITNTPTPPLTLPPSPNSTANTMAMSPDSGAKNQTTTTSSNDFSSSSQQAKSQDNVLNFELSLVGSVRNQLVTEGQNYSFQIPASIFVHSNPNEQLVFEAKTSSGKALPAWLNFDPKTLKFSGVPPKGVAPETVTVTAKDSYGKEVSATFKVGISKEDNTQTKPQLDNQQGDIPVLPNTPSPNASIQKPISNTRLVNHFEALHSKQSFTQQVHMAGKLSRLQESRALLDSLKNL